MPAHIVAKGIIVPQNHSVQNHVLCAHARVRLYYLSSLDIHSWAAHSSLNSSFTILWWPRRWKHVSTNKCHPELKKQTFPGLSEHSIHTRITSTFNIPRKLTEKLINWKDSRRLLPCVVFASLLEIAMLYYIILPQPDSKNSIGCNLIPGKPEDIKWSKLS